MPRQPLLRGERVHPHHERRFRLREHLYGPHAVRLWLLRAAHWQYRHSLPGLVVLPLVALGADCLWDPRPPSRIYLSSAVLATSRFRPRGRMINGHRNAPPTRKEPSPRGDTIAYSRRHGTGRERLKMHASSAGGGRCGHLGIGLRAR